MPELTDDLKVQIGRMFNDLYFGNGRPALTVRMQQAEDDVNELRQMTVQIRADIRKVVLLILAAVLAEVMKLIFAKGI